MKVFFNNITAFKSNIAFDIGGSRSEGSCKITYYAENNEDIFYKENTTVNKLGNSTFKNSENFVDLIAEKIGSVQKFSESIVEAKGYRPEENIIRNVAIFVPGNTYETVAVHLPNLKDNSNMPLENVDFANLKDILKKDGVKVSDNLNIKILQDVLGAGVAIGNKLYNMGMLEEGSDYTVCITGGGCGIADIEHIGDNIIVKSSGSSCLSQNYELQKVSTEGASSSALISNFCRSMGFSDAHIRAIKSCNQGEIVLNAENTFEKNIKTNKLKELLLETGKYKVTADDGSKYTIKVQDEFLSQFTDAQKSAIDKYCHAITRLAVIKRNEGSNGLIVTGPLAKAINETLIKNGNDGIAGQITQNLIRYFNSYSLDKSHKIFDFRIFCDNNFHIENNTDCGNLIHKAEFTGAKRFNWLKINTKYLKKSIKF